MPASTLSETKRLQSRFLPFLTSRGIVTRSVLQLPKPQIPRLRCAPLGMTKQKAKSEKRRANSGPLLEGISLMAVLAKSWSPRLAPRPRQIRARLMSLAALPRDDRAKGKAKYDNCGAFCAYRGPSTRPRNNGASSLGMTKQKAKSEKRRAAFLRFPQRPRNRHARGTQRRQQSADKSHYDCENDAHQQRCRRDLERKCQFTEAIGLSRSRGITVHGEGDQTTEDAAENGQQHRFQHKRKQDAEAREAQSAQRANLARALPDNGVHGVHGAKHGADAHNHGDERRQPQQRLRRRASQVLVILRLRIHFQLYPRIGAHVFVEACQHRRVGQAQRQRLAAAVAMDGGCHGVVVTPDFALEGAAIGGEQPHHLPVFFSEY